MNHTKVHNLEEQILLNEQLAATTSWMEELQQEQDYLARGLEATQAREHPTLGKISSMLSRVELAKQKANDVEAAAEEMRQKLTNSRLHLVGLKRTLEYLKAKMTQDQTEQTERKKEWAREWEVTLWDSPKINKELGERIFTFLRLSFNDCTAQFQADDFPPTGEAPMFLDISKTLGRVSEGLFLLNLEWYLLDTLRIGSPRNL